MTIEVSQGQTATLDLELRNRAGALADADAGTLALTLAELDGTVVDGFPIAEAGVTHLGTGLYQYLWSAPIDQAPGTLLAEWDGYVAGEQIDTAIEDVFVLPAEIVLPADGLVSLATAEAWLRVTPDSGGPNDTNVGRLLRAVSSEIRGRTRRPFEGVPTVYDEVLDSGHDWPLGRGRWLERSLWLPKTPVADVLSIRSVHWDGTEAEVLEPNDVVGGYATTLAATALAGDSALKVVSVARAEVGRLIRVGPTSRREVVRITAVGTAGSGGTGLSIEPALPQAQASGDPVAQVSGSLRWHVADADTGRVLITRWPDRVRVIWRTTGEIPADVEQACLDWMYDRWTSRTRQRVASRSNGVVSETYRLGPPPSEVARVLAGHTVMTAGGPV